MNGWVEASTTSLARLERQPGHREQIGTGFEPTYSVELRKLRVEAEAGQDRFESLELRFDRLERWRRFRLGFQVALDHRAHRPEDVLLHQEVFVVVRGGRVTTRTLGAPEADEEAAAASHACCCFFAAAISFFRWLGLPVVGPASVDDLLDVHRLAS